MPIQTPISRTAAAARILEGSVASFGPLIFHYDASKITGVADGGTVASVSDLSGNGFTISQASEAAKPTLVLNQYNGLPCLRFNGSSQFLARADDNNLDNLLIDATRAQRGFTTFAVVKNSGSVAVDAQIIWAKQNGNGGGTAGYGPKLYISKSGANNYALIYSVQSDNASNRRSGTSQTIFGSSSRILVSTFINSGNQVIIENGANSTVTQDTTASGAFNGNASEFLVGCMKDINVAVYFWNGDIMEIGCFNKMLNPAELTNFNRSLATKWRIALSGVYA